VPKKGARVLQKFYGRLGRDPTLLSPTSVFDAVGVTGPRREFPLGAQFYLLLFHKFLKNFAVCGTPWPGNQS